MTLENNTKICVNSCNSSYQYAYIYNDSVSECLTTCPISRPKIESNTCVEGLLNYTCLEN